mmetsp:Transcript_10696/g.33259  ORF Transcript_10696/g.33259 Transcript_10696/m.33259 type:complete len:430 (-) Transcript_10696:2081-3370(-)
MVQDLPAGGLRRGLAGVRRAALPQARDLRAGLRPAARELPGGAAPHPAPAHLRAGRGRAHRGAGPPHEPRGARGRGRGPQGAQPHALGGCRGRGLRGQHHWLPPRGRPRRLHGGRPERRDRQGDPLLPQRALRRGGAPAHPGRALLARAGHRRPPGHRALRPAGAGRRHRHGAPRRPAPEQRGDRDAAGPRRAPGPAPAALGGPTAEAAGGAPRGGRALRLPARPGRRGHRGAAERAALAAEAAGCHAAGGLRRGRAARGPGGAPAGRPGRGPASGQRPGLPEQGRGGQGRRQRGRGGPGRVAAPMEPDGGGGQVGPGPRALRHPHHEGPAPAGWPALRQRLDCRAAAARHPRGPHAPALRARHDATPAVRGLLQVLGERLPGRCRGALRHARHRRVAARPAPGEHGGLLAGPVAGRPAECLPLRREQP